MYQSRRNVHVWGREGNFVDSLRSWWDLRESDIWRRKRHFFFPSRPARKYLRAAKPRVKLFCSSPILSRLRRSRSWLRIKTKAPAREIPPAAQAISLTISDIRVGKRRVRSVIVSGVRGRRERRHHSRSQCLLTSSSSVLRPSGPRNKRFTLSSSVSYIFFKRKEFRPLNSQIM